MARTAEDLIDARGPRFASVITAVVLGIALIGVYTPLFPMLVGLQALVFFLGAALGVRRQPYVAFFAAVLAPRLPPAPKWQDPTAPRITQAIALVLLVVALVSWAFGGLTVATVCVAAAFVVALTLALTGFCIGCEGYAVYQDLKRTS
jgi:thiosulfate/3-mercaptopyruvate sulfurtransferase